MKKLLVMAMMLIGSSAMAADWTPYLKGMQNNCELSEETKKILNKDKAIPKALKADVVRHKANNYCEPDSDNCDFSKHLQLKNATAFGHSLKSIVFSEDDFGSYVQLDFANEQFMQLMPSFVLSFGNVQIKPNQKEVYLVDVSYDDNDKMIIGNYKKATYPKVVQTSDPSTTYEYFYPLLGSNQPQYNEVYYSTPTGWGMIGQGMHYLDFSKKQKSIVCSSYF